MAMRKTDKSDSEDFDIILDEAFWKEVAAAVPGIDVLSYEEAWQLLEDSAQFYFKISANEFIRRWDLGDFPEDEMEKAAMLSWTIPVREPR